MEEKKYTNCTNSGPIDVFVKDGVVVRVTPMHIKESDYTPWKIDARGKEFSAPKRVTLAPYTMTERQRLYSEDRIKYPLKRKDWDPRGNRNPQNRGKSGYDRISWDEALDIVSGEIRRVQDTFGPEALSAVASSHHNWGLVGYKMSTFARFFNMIGFTSVFDNPDSWEGWHWGASHAYGFYWKLGMPEQFDMLEDALKHTEMIVHWSNDPDSTRSVYNGQESAIWRVWLKQLGIKQIFIDPYCNYTAGCMADKWIAPRPGTDAAMAEAIAYVWIKENTYDKEYLDTHTLDFDEFKKLILGETDGTPRTPGWASELTGVPTRTIVALAREWASKRTMMGCGTRGGEGGACRTAYATEWARLMVFLNAMQGLGKPGVGFWGATMGAPMNCDVFFPGYSDPQGSISYSPAADHQITNPVKQRLYRLTVPDAILNPPVSWLGEGFCGKSLEQQFIPYTYPLPGKSEIKMWYRYGSSYIGTMLDTNKWVKFYQSPKLECVVNQDCWWGSETPMADIILPACTNLERYDIGEWASPGGYGYSGLSSIGCNNRVVIFEQKCIEPLWESKADYDIFTLLAERLGRREEYTEGKTDKDWVKALFDFSDLPKHISWEEFTKKGYFVVPFPKDYKSTPAFRWFYEGRECDTPDFMNPKRNTEKGKELGTYSGKIEFVSRSLTQHTPEDTERPPLGHYIPSWEGHQSELAGKYPLQLIAPHPRFSFHTHYDWHSPWLGDIPAHRTKKDGYPYNTVRIHPSDAQTRGIANGDIVKLYNDRGKVLGIAQVTERVRPGIIHSYGSAAKYDPIEPGKAGSIDRGGCVNLLTSPRMISANAPGMTPNSCLIEIEKWDA